MEGTRPLTGPALTNDLCGRNVKVKVKVKVKNNAVLKLILAF